MLVDKNARLLRWILLDHPEYLDDQKRLRSALKDVFAHDKLFCNLLILVIDTGIFSEIKSVMSEQSRPSSLVYSTKLVKEYGVSEDHANSVLTCLENVFCLMAENVIEKDVNIKSKHNEDGGTIPEEMIRKCDELFALRDLTGLEKQVYTKLNTSCFADFNDEEKCFLKSCQKPFEISYYGKYGKDGLPLRDKEGVHISLEAVNWNGELSFAFTIRNNTNKQLIPWASDYSYSQVVVEDDSVTILSEEKDNKIMKDGEYSDDDGECYRIAENCTVSLCCSKHQPWFFEENLIEFTLTLWEDHEFFFDSYERYYAYIRMVYYPVKRRLGIQIHEYGSELPIFCWVDCDNNTEVGEEEARQLDWES